MLPPASPQTPALDISAGADVSCIRPCLGPRRSPLAVGCPGPRAGPCEQSPSTAPTSQLSNHLPPPRLPGSRVSPREPSGPWLACRPGPLPPAAGTCSLARLLSRTWGQGRPHRDQGRWEVSWSDDQHSLCGPQGARALKSRRRVDHPGREGLGARWARAQVPLAGLVPAPRSTRWPGPPWPRRSRGSLTRLWSPVSLPVATSKTGRGRSPSASGAGPWPGRGWPVKGHSPSSALTQAQGRRARVRAGGVGPGLGVGLGARAQGLQTPCLPAQPPQHPVPGAVVPGGGPVHHCDI